MSLRNDKGCRECRAFGDTVNDPKILFTQLMGARVVVSDGNTIRLPGVANCKSWDSACGGKLLISADTGPSRATAGGRRAAHLGRQRPKLLSTG